MVAGILCGKQAAANRRGSDGNRAWAPAALHTRSCTRQRWRTPAGRRRLDAGPAQQPCWLGGNGAGCKLLQLLAAVSELKRHRAAGRAQRRLCSRHGALHTTRRPRLADWQRRCAIAPAHLDSCVNTSCLASLSAAALSFTTYCRRVGGQPKAAVGARDFVVSCTTYCSAGQQHTQRDKWVHWTLCSQLARRVLCITCCSCIAGTDADTLPCKCGTLASPASC